MGRMGAGARELQVREGPARPSKINTNTSIAAQTDWRKLVHGSGELLMRFFNCNWLDQYGLNTALISILFVLMLLRGGVLSGRIVSVFWSVVTSSLASHTPLSLSVVNVQTFNCGPQYKRD